MAEKTYTHHRHEQDRPAGEHAELHNHDLEKLDELIEKGKESRHEHAEKLNEIRHEAHEQAQSAEELLAEHTEKEKPEEGPGLVGKDLKSLKYKRTLQSVRKDLSGPERVLSRVVHNSAVDAVSEVAGKTIARPSGLLSGAFFAFLGSSIFLWVAKHYGYQYNFLLFTLLFVAGFGLGLLLELLVRLMRRRKA
jgi:hypothetical protein